MPPAGFDVVTSLNHLENGLPFTLAFCAVIGEALIQLQRWNIFAHYGIWWGEVDNAYPLLALLDPGMHGELLVFPFRA